MSYRKFSAILTVIALNLALSACGGNGLPYKVESLSRPAATDPHSITVYVVTKYAMTEIVADSERYTDWQQLLQSEFDDSTSDRASIVWRGSYVLSVGILRPNDANKIMVYFNGSYSELFVLNCSYQAGSVLAFVERGIDAQTLNKLMSN